MARVSVIIPVYKAEKYIEKCVRSLFEQTLVDMEFIFVDDSSPDNSIRVLKSLIDQYPMRKSQIKIISHSQNKGVSAARNSGLKIATGQYIAYCDSDDFVDLRMYDEMYEKAIESNADAVLCDFYMHYGEQDNQPVQTIDVIDKENTLKNYIGYGWTLISTIMVKKSIYDTHGILSLENIKYCEDFYLNFRLLYASEKMAKVYKSLYYYNRTNENSVMHHLDDQACANERSVYFEVIKMLQQDDVINVYEKEISWRILKNKQDMVLCEDYHKTFMDLFPISHKYILSCPTTFCNNKIKFMMWLLTHNYNYLLHVILFLRKLIRK